MTFWSSIPGFFVLLMPMAPGVVTAAMTLHHADRTGGEWNRALAWLSLWLLIGGAAISWALVSWLLPGRGSL